MRRTLRKTLYFSTLAASCFCITPLLSAQALSSSTASISSLPSAPVQSISVSNSSLQEIAQAMPPAGQMPAPNAVPSGPLVLTREQAEQIALKNNPRISVSQLMALVQHQVVRETRSGELPDLTGNLTAVQAQEASRISSGYLSASRVLEHAGMGVELNQLITDFGRTPNLVASSRFQEKAQLANAEATREDIVLATDMAFYSALQAQATLEVAQQTVNTRQTLTDQVLALTKSNLKSTLDLSFAQVNLSEAKLLQLDAQNNLDASMASLDAVLGFQQQRSYKLVDSTDSLPVPPADANALIALAFKQRPDLQALDYNRQAAVKYSRAQHEQLLPSISALGVVGGTPVGSSQYFNSTWYGAIGVNMSVPVFNGFRYQAQASQASLEVKAANERVRDMQDRIVRDVRTAWLAANANFQRVTVTDQLLKEANMALSLAQTRYQLGLSSIVELSQAQLQQTQAAISNANARYQYQLALATLNFQTGVRP
ncbi:MAG: TolC family protein [Acidobacteriaceae bacterium]